MKKNEKGFGLIAVLLLVIVVAVTGLGGYIVLLNQPKDQLIKPKEASTKPAADATKKTPTPLADSYKDWKEYKSSLSGYTVKYPKEWVLQDYTNNGQVFTNDAGGVSQNFTLTSVKRTGSYGGHDANTYLCVIFDEYSETGWQRSPLSTKNLVTVESFKPNSARELAIVLQESDRPMLEQFVLSDGTSNYISLDSKYILTASVMFNCMQGDYSAIEGSNEKFTERQETKAAKEILKSLRF